MNRAEWVESWTPEEGENWVAREAAVTARQANCSPPLLVMDRAEGIWVTDVFGRRYIDVYGNNCHHTGYRHPRILGALIAQAEKLSFTSRGLSNPVSIQFAEKLAQLSPHKNARVYAVPGGSAAVETALALARVATNRFKTLSFYGSYHGRTLGALSVGGRSKDTPQKLGPLLPGALHVASFHDRALDIEVSAQRSLDQICKVLFHEGDIACLIAEPIRNGPYVPPSWYWPEVRKLCDRYGILLIFDEIPVGLGKTGHLFNAEAVGVKPDITVLGKSLGGGFVPLAAIVTNGELDCAPDMNIGYYTHEKNPLMAAVGLATLDVLIDEGLPDNAQTLGKRGFEKLTALSQATNKIHNIRGAGLMLGFSLSGDLEAASRSAQQLVFKALELGMIVNYAGGPDVTLSCPLIISPVELDMVFSILTTALSEIK